MQRDKLIERIKRLAELAARDSTPSPEALNAGRTLARLIVENPVIFDNDDKEGDDDGDDPIDGAIDELLTKLGKEWLSPNPREHKPAKPRGPAPFPGAIFVGFDEYGREVWRR